MFLFTCLLHFLMKHVLITIEEVVVYKKAMYVVSFSTMYVVSIFIIISNY